MVDLDMVGIFSFARSSETETLALTALVYLAHPNINKLFATAPTHVAATNFTNRSHSVGARVVKSFNQQNPTLTETRHIPLVIRGYSFNREPFRFFNVVDNRSLMPHSPKGPVRWELPLSLCE